MTVLRFVNLTCIQYTFLIRNLSLRWLGVYDRTFNFKPDPIILPQYVPTEWPRAGYQQLLETTHKAVLPKISVDQIEAYYRLAGNTVIYYHRQIKKKSKSYEQYSITLAYICILSIITLIITLNAFQIHTCSIWLYRLMNNLYCLQWNNFCLTTMVSCYIDLH